MVQYPWCEPSDYKNRHIAIIGAGVLGRRIATCWACAGYNVYVYDHDVRQCREAVTYFDENKVIYQQYASVIPAQVIPAVDLTHAVSRAWLVVECVSENLALKQKVFCDLESVCTPDCILSTNSSSYKSSIISEKTRHARNRILNTHYFMPPHVRIVELMTNGCTAPNIFPFLNKRMEEAGLSVYVAKKESTGFIHNRVWAAIKRELLKVVSEGVADPKTADDIFFEAIVKPGTRPFVAMDLVGLDTVAMIERNFAEERNLSTVHTVDFLQREFIEKGKLGLKSNNGGFYPSSVVPTNPGPRILVLDNGLSGQVETLEKGKVLEYTSTGQYIRTIFDEQYLPDGIVVLKEKEQMFWTCMGYPGQNDGMIYSANLDGSDVRSLIDKGRINTPKQIALDSVGGKLYFADREGLCIWRCGLDGSKLEKVITTMNMSDGNDRDATNWCVGITLSRSLGRIFWTQKGGPKGWQGRIFTASIDILSGETPGTRSDKVCLLKDLAEPIDLEFHEESRSLYWTDRGEMPFGNTLNRLRFAHNGQVLEVDNTPLLNYQILARKFHEAIGLKIDEQNQHVYVADLGGSICRCNLDGSEKTRLLFEEGRAFTGIALV
ncbi:unnamed protein product [Penicillium nalgiovense]|uniref:3-hydroxyacyl-CoA dehydrogenase n=1 Tax=Penicillium nalgiovense TaxID=60175 RepID=A0A9W4MWP5_PENNA|nr:unnamed protein product [Penicillium nalgiovense]CAG8078207.1 unnamed protein product [Penicillium nalgiovense]CAG8081672.1 unnamed protein product [Penicillium nalgiovense]CAG8090053.1 unnamed protein product [Penicillium nalgiovense]CAG8093456.1 unnamed protein product [Penicillium nalgiovense]